MCSGTGVARAARGSLLISRMRKDRERRQLRHGQKRREVSAREGKSIRIAKIQPAGPGEGERRNSTIAARLGREPGFDTGAALGQLGVANGSAGGNVKNVSGV